MPKKHYTEIDTLKGIAIFLVILGHSIIQYPVNLMEISACKTLFRYSSTVHMPLFFTIAGFCFSYNGNYKDFLLKKTKRLLVPYFAFGLVDIFARVLLPQFVNRTSGVLKLLKFIIIYGGEYWFLYTLFLIFLLYPVLYSFMENHLYRQLIVLTAILVLDYYLPGIELFQFSKLVRYLIFFTSGVILKQNCSKCIPNDNLSQKQYVLFFVLCFSFWLYIMSHWPNSLFPNRLKAVLGIVTFYWFAKLKPVSFIFSRFGQYSLQLYLLNGFFLVASRTLIVTILNVTNPFLIICFNMFVDFFLSYLFIKYVCSRFKPLRFLLGM